MCWATYRKVMCKTAKENIEIFKVCSVSDINPKNLISVYWQFEYELNKIYSTKKDLEIIAEHCISYCEINEGFHSYAPNCTIIKDHVIAIWNGNNFLDSYNVNEAVVKGYIPAGAHYYLNERGEYVSDKICLTKIKTL